MLLEVFGLKVSVGNLKVLENISLSVDKGKLHALMGPNGSGKTTLAKALLGHPDYKIISGRIMFEGEDITSLPPHERSRRGIFLFFQEPVEVPGIRLSTFLIALYNRRRGYKDLTKVSDPKIISVMKELVNEVGLKQEHLLRELNMGASGGEKKRIELLQLLLFRPKLAILDEPDSGMDVDGVRMVAEFIERLVKEGTGVILITHYARLFNYIKPHKVSVLQRGYIVETGGPEIAERIEREGYAVFEG